MIPEARTPAEAMLLLRTLTALPGHEFWADDIAIASSEYVYPHRIVGHRQVTDAHLVALAQRHAGHLVTFDAGLVDVLPEGHEARARLTVLPPPPS